MRDRPMDRRTFLEYATVGGAAVAATPGGPTIPALARGVSFAPTFELEEATIAELQAGMASGKYTSRSITAAYLQRIEALDKKGPGLRSVLDEVQGIGPKRKRELLRRFGSVKGIRAATLEELASVPGMTLKQARVLRTSL